jgi:hypothetical protein
MKTFLTNSLMMLALALCMASCKKELPGSCYDKAYHDQHKNDICTMDCPGVTGCDGKNYCNECIMRTNGIRRVQ